MPKNSWTYRQLKRLQKEYPRCKNPRKLANSLRKSYLALKSKATVLGLRRIAIAEVRRTIVSKAHDKIIKKKFLSVPVKALAKKLGYNKSIIERRIASLGLIIPKELIEQRKKDSQFKKGSLPYNKGKKLKDFMSKEAIARTVATRFKKGQLPHNAIGFKNGDISIRKGKGDKKDYKYIRLDLGKWHPLHTYRWEKKHGKVPKGHCLWFKDGNSMNCKVSNLELITRQENMRRNSCSLMLTDNYVAMTLVREKGGVGLFNMELLEEIKKDKDLVSLKRAQLVLQRTIKSKSTNEKSKPGRPRNQQPHNCRPA